MSMLTPPGMGGQYRIKGDKFPRMRHNRRRRNTVLAVSALTVATLSGWGVLQLVDAFTGGSTSPEVKGRSGADCERQSAKSRPAAKPLPKPGAITVNVLNATKRTGLADKTAAILKKRGFKIGEVTNAPAAYDKKYKKAALLLGPPTAQDAFKVLGTQLEGAQTRTEAREGQEIDLIIGAAFTKLTQEAKAKQALSALNEPAAPKTPKDC